jgi:transposase
MRRPRRNHTAVFKAKVALAALKGDKTLAELVEKYDVHGSQITQWKTQLLDGAIGVFSSPAEKRGTEQGPSAKEMQAKIGQLALEVDFLEVALGRVGDASAKR